LGQQKKYKIENVFDFSFCFILEKTSKEKKKRGELKTESAKHTVLNLARGRTTESVDGSGFLGAPR